LTPLVAVHAPPVGDAGQERAEGCGDRGASRIPSESASPTLEGRGRQIDAIQVGGGEGPCISAAREGATMRSGSLAGGPRAEEWPGQGGAGGDLSWLTPAGGNEQPDLFWQWMTLTRIVGAACLDTLGGLTPGRCLQAPDRDC